MTNQTDLTLSLPSTVVDLIALAVTGRLRETLVSKLVDDFDTEDIAQQIADKVTCYDIAQEIPLSDLAGEFSERDIAREIDIDMVTEAVCESINHEAVAGHVSTEDVAEHIDLSDLSDYIDMEALASEVDGSVVARYLDHELLSQHARIAIAADLETLRQLHEKHVLSTGRHIEELHDHIAQRKANEDAALDEVFGLAERVKANRDGLSDVAYSVGHMSATLARVQAKLPGSGFLARLRWLLTGR